MRIGSLFAGIGGLELGLERGLAVAGVESHTVFQVEMDPFCQRVLERHWPYAQRFSDVCTVDARTLPAVDILCGGFPCQDVSVAGKGVGLAGERSGLWREFLRLIRDLRPCIVVVENVAALLARGLGTVLGDLASCGYDAEWDCIPAASVGAPHRRDRLFIVAYTVGIRVRVEQGRQLGQGRAAGAALAAHDGTHGAAADTECARLERPTRRRDDCEGGASVEPASGNPPADTDSDGCERLTQRDSKAQAGCEVLDRDHADGRAVARDAPDTSRAGLEGGWQGLPTICARSWGQPPSAIRRVDDGLRDGVDRPRRRRPVNDKPRLHALGNAVVPQVAEVIGRRVAEILLRATM